jgi:hypothetical protein
MTIAKLNIIPGIDEKKIECSDSQYLLALTINGSPTYVTYHTNRDVD